MTRPLPDLIDPLRLSSKDSVLRGDLKLSQMGRLQGTVCESDGATNKNALSVDLAFATDQSGQANVTGLISVVLWIQCQRCLQTMRWDNNIKVSLAFVKSELEADKLSARYEPFFLNVDEDMLSLAELIESEILLALPQEAMHAKQECAIDSRYKGESEVDATTQATVGLQKKHEQSKVNPFAVLKQMKKK